jgi:hypothetical protein
MGTIMFELTNNLVIFRPEDEETADKDVLFYIYEKVPYEIGQDISLEELEKIGKRIINMKELDTNVVRKAASIVTPMVRKKGTVLGYRVFGFLLLMKLSMDIILSYTYAKGLAELSNDIVDSEGSVAYKLGQYFLNELNYTVGFSKDAIDILSNEQQFKDLYNILVDKLEKADNIEIAYDNFIEAIKDIKLNL